MSRLIFLNIEINAIPLNQFTNDMQTNGGFEPRFAFALTYNKYKPYDFKNKYTK